MSRTYSVDKLLHKPEPKEYTATIEDFFSDESEDEESDDSDMQLGPGGKQGKAASTKKRKKKKGKQAATTTAQNPDLTATEFRKIGKDIVDFIGNLTFLSLIHFFLFDMDQF